MQPERIILIPPTHEQSTPSYHVEESLAEDFLKFLKTKGITAWQPPESLTKQGPDLRPVVEIEIEAGTPTKLLEELIGEFQSGQSPAEEE